MAITVCAAILGALLLAHTVVPVASSYLLKLAGTEHEEAWFLRLRRYYVAHLEDAMNHHRRTLAVALAVVTLALASLALIGTEFMPRLYEGAILIETRKLPSISLEESAAISTRVEQIVRRFPEVSQVVTKIGRPDVATEAMGIYQGDVYVNLHPMDSWKSGWSKEELIDRRRRWPMPGGLQLHPPMAMPADSGLRRERTSRSRSSAPTATLEPLGQIRAVLDSRARLTCRQVPPAPRSRSTSIARGSLGTG
jgi:cobalt-zinc-cadmium resistance protein CzcA